MPEYDGIVLVDKSAGLTSHDVVDIMRRLLGMRRIGHAGTLDPDATGLLIILVGAATRLFSRFSHYDKVYEVTVTFGVSTATADASGAVLSRKPVPSLSREELELLLARFQGESVQVPPMVSAKKIKGRKLYELARKGIEVERPGQRILIHEIRLGQVRLPEVDFVVRCSKGTYVRTLCEDIGKAVGCGGHLSRLRRLAVGPYRVEQAVTLAELRTLAPDQLRQRVLAPDPAA